MVTRSGKIIRLLLLLLILAGVLPFFFPWQKPLLSWRTLSLPELPDVSDKLPSLPEVPGITPISSEDKAEKTGPVTVYRWQDEQGGWHFTNEQPQQGVKYESMTIDPDTNLLPGQLQESPEQPAPDQNTTQAAGNGNGYTAEELIQLKQKAEAAKKALEQRYREQEERLQELR